MFVNGFTLFLLVLAFAGGYGYRVLLVNSREYYDQQQRQRLLASDTPIHDQLKDEWDF
jgi:hypothetical protein